MELDKQPAHISSSAEPLPELFPINEDEMSPSVSDVEKEPQALNPSEWAHLVNSLPLFPPPDVPPPLLYPLLSPLLQQKLGLLSLGRGRNWPGVLSWLSPELSFKVHDRLKTAVWRPDGVKQEFRGYRRFDNELLVANVSLEEEKLDFWFSWLPSESGNTRAEKSWKLHDVRLSEIDTDLNWFPSMYEATLRYHEISHEISTGSTGSENDSGDAAEWNDDDDAYWSQYDHYNGPAGGNAPKDAPSKDQDETSYYERYNEVETAVGGDKTQPPTATVADGSALGGEPISRGNEVNDAMEDYIRATVRNLGQLAFRCGMSQERFVQIINEEIAN